MDCLQAREIISEAFDRGVAEVPQAAEAREHCRDCAECRRFVEGLALLRKTPPPAAPTELIESIVERGRLMAEAGVPRSVPRPVEPAAEDAAPASAEPPASVVLLSPVPRTEVHDRAWWIPRLAVAGAAVAVAGFALFLSFQGFRALRTPGASGPPPAALSDQQTSKSTPSADGGARMLSSAPAYSASGAGSARYIALGDETYSWIGIRTPDAASITQLGTVTSSLDSSAAPTQRDVWRSKSDPDVVFVRSMETSETYVAFRRVVRTFGGKLYSLYGNGISGYGQWPALPSRFSTPTASDGSPTFVSAGKDDTGLEIFAPPGASADQGFAIPPGTTPGDPAGGDPNWTWWFPEP